MVIIVKLFQEFVAQESVIILLINFKADLVRIRRYDYDHPAVFREFHHFNVYLPITSWFKKWMLTEEAH